MHRRHSSGNLGKGRFALWLLLLLLPCSSSLSQQVLQCAASSGNWGFGRSFNSSDIDSLGLVNRVLDRLRHLCSNTGLHTSGQPRLSGRPEGWRSSRSLTALSPNSARAVRAASIGLVPETASGTSSSSSVVLHATTAAAAASHSRERRQTLEAVRAAIHLNHALLGSRSRC